MALDAFRNSCSILLCRFITSAVFMFLLKKKDKIILYQAWVGWIKNQKVLIFNSVTISSHSIIIGEPPKKF